MENVKEFLQESNHIENVWDKRSLTQALQAWKYITSCETLTIKNILETHDILMKDHLPYGDRGTFRKVAVFIGGKAAKPWYAVPELTEHWVEQANKTVQEALLGSASFDVQERIRQDHVAFEAIHPFIDGNGRMGRILLNWQRIKAGQDILVIKEKEKYTYYAWFHEGESMRFQSTPTDPKIIADIRSKRGY